MDYQSNSRKSKEEQQKKEKPKEIEKVIEGEAIVRKRPLGTRLKETFLGGDAQSVARYIAAEVLLPAFRNLLVDATTKGVERMVYGESSTPRRPQNYGPRITYNNPVNRGYMGDPRYRSANLPDQPTYSPPPRSDGAEILLPDRAAAELVLERLQDIIDQYDVASLADLKQLVGLPTVHTDNKWGWVMLRGADIRQIREGYLLDLPPAEQI